MIQAASDDIDTPLAAGPSDGPAATHSSAGKIGPGCSVGERCAPVLDDKPRDTPAFSAGQQLDGGHGGGGNSDTLIGAGASASLAPADPAARNTGGGLPIAASAPPILGNDRGAHPVGVNDDVNFGGKAMGSIAVRHVTPSRPGLANGAGSAKRRRVYADLAMGGAACPDQPPPLDSPGDDGSPNVCVAPCAGPGLNSGRTP